MKSYDLYLFDFDGTLFDSRESMFPIFARGFGIAGRSVTKEEADEWISQHEELEYEEGDGTDILYFEESWDDAAFTIFAARLACKPTVLFTTIIFCILQSSKKLFFTNYTLTCRLRKQYQVIPYPLGTQGKLHHQ